MSMLSTLPSRSLCTILTSAFFGCLSSAVAQASPWGLPLEVDHKNTQVSFEVDSTWHTIHGKALAATGKVWLENPEDPNSIRATLAFPVKQFDTEDEDRDARMREVMQEPQFGAVTFAVTHVDGLCATAELTEKGRCNATLAGKLKIRDVEKDVTFPVTIRPEGDGAVVTGAYAFDWSSFGVEDPSIIVARLNKTVTIKFSLHLSART